MKWWMGQTHVIVSLIWGMRFKIDLTLAWFILSLPGLPNVEKLSECHCSNSICQYSIILHLHQNQLVSNKDVNDCVIPPTQKRYISLKHICAPQIETIIDVYFGWKYHMCILKQLFECGHSYAQMMNISRDVIKKLRLIQGLSVLL